MSYSVISTIIIMPKFTQKFIANFAHPVFATFVITTHPEVVFTHFLGFQVPHAFFVDHSDVANVLQEGEFSVISKIQVQKKSRISKKSMVTFSNIESVWGSGSGGRFAETFWVVLNLFFYGF